MNIFTDPVKETIAAAEQAVEKAEDHTTPHIIEIIDAVFVRLWQTRITIDIGQRKD